MADIVDFRAPKAGRSGFAGGEDTCVAGDAGIVLNLFLPSAGPLKDVFESVDDRAVRGVVVVAEFLGLSPTGFNGVLALEIGFFSAADEELAATRCAVDEIGGLFSASFEAVAGVRDARLAAPDTNGFLVSA